MGNLVDYRTDRGVAVITLDDPPVNSYTHEMLTELDGLITDARFDEDVHVVVITGRGEHCFSAGASIGMLREVDAEFRSNFFRHASDVLTRIEHTPMLFIAALNGHAVSGGLELALACDLRIARQGNGLLGLPEIGMGLIPATGGTQRLARIVGKGRAMQLLLEGTKIDFETALSMGLLHYVWPAASAGAFLDRVLEYAKRFTPPECPVFALGKLKRAVQAAFELPIEQGLLLEQELAAQVLGSADAAEGLAAWIEKRSPKFQGS